MRHLAPSQLRRLRPGDAEFTKSITSQAEVRFADNDRSPDLLGLKRSREEMKLNELQRQKVQEEREGGGEGEEERERERERYFNTVIVCCFRQSP